MRLPNGRDTILGGKCVKSQYYFKGKKEKISIEQLFKRPVKAYLYKQCVSFEPETIKITLNRNWIYQIIKIAVNN